MTNQITMIVTGSCWLDFEKKTHRRILLPFIAIHKNILPLLHENKGFSMSLHIFDIFGSSFSMKS